MTHYSGTGTKIGRKHGHASRGAETPEPDNCRWATAQEQTNNRRPKEARQQSTKVRGMAQASLDLIETMQAVARAAQPITGRGVGYKLFTRGLIASMARPEMQRVYRLLKQAREQGIVPWLWIVDETRSVERMPTWSNPAKYARCVAQSYRRDFWDQQPHRVQVWSEKGTVRGVLAPVLERYAVGFLPVHGFSSATTAHDIAEDDDGRDLIVLYVGDFDPSGMFMSEADLPNRFARYNGNSKQHSATTTLTMLTRPMRAAHDLQSSKSLAVEARRQRLQRLAGFIRRHRHSSRR
jgi:hypothetical protein